jgi:hypothetical protein
MSGIPQLFGIANHYYAFVVAHSGMTGLAITECLHYERVKLQV